MHMRYEYDVTVTNPEQTTAMGFTLESRSLAAQTCE
jgi:hypothetical protein